MPPARPSPVVTAAEMRAIEAAAIAGGRPADALMQDAGAAAARAIAAFAGTMPALVLCGPGNNGGDGYVIARVLCDIGWPVRVAASAAPSRDPARAAATRWAGPVEPLDDATAPAPLLVDALFGIGLARAIDEAVMRPLHRLAAAARVRVAIDLPSGVATDDGAWLSQPVAADLTVTFGALKPGHLLQPGAQAAGRLVVAGIGLEPPSPTLFRIDRPALPALAPDAHKFTRGHVLVVGGDFASASAARLTALAAARGGAGYVTLASPKAALAANAAHLTDIVLRAADDAAALAALIGDKRVAAVAIGPGLGIGRHAARSRSLVLAALEAGVPAVLDADVFTLFADDPDTLFAAVRGPAVMTPHEGEFTRLFGTLPGSKVDRARAAAARANAVVVLKGPDTVVAAPDGRAAIAADGPVSLATAGSGDVLTGIVAALLARGMPAFEAACAAVWLHGEAGRRGGPGLVASDLPRVVGDAL